VIFFALWKYLFVRHGDWRSIPSQQLTATVPIVAIAATYPTSPAYWRKARQFSYDFAQLQGEQFPLQQSADLEQCPVFRVTQSSPC
jgi:hypothetical protein